jgi:threonine synthase
MTRQSAFLQYRHLMDLPEYTTPVTLQEGNTPLIPLPRLAEKLGGGAEEYFRAEDAEEYFRYFRFELYVKYEGLNPTGSFKDRGMAAAISEAAGRGVETVICASTGNTAASAAAYAARAGMRAIVLIPEGKVATGKLAGAAAYGARIIQIQGSFDQALDLVVELTQKYPIGLVNSLNPYRLEGQKTAAFEICDELGAARVPGAASLSGAAPDWLCLPVGNAGNITAYWMGFRQYDRLHGTGLPRLLGVQAAGAAPLVLGRPVDKPETVATAIRIGRPARGEQALQAAEESRGRIVAASDEDILTAQKLLAGEGVWVEPASAAGLAGLIQEIRASRLSLKGKRVVIVCTGHGLKDPEVIVSRMATPVVIPASAGALEEMIAEKSE